MDNRKLSDRILSLIETKREDDYWDFKQCHHHNKADLLHDIICMANNRSNQNGYIIFGIQDKTFDIIGIESDENRRNQQNIIDFLKEKSFSMNVRPKIQLVTLDIFQHQLDILIIYNTLDTPFYLTSDYKDKGKTVRANYIYTRVGDTNTDINKSADPNHIEFLWKKRFGLHLSPFEKLRHNLKKKKDWINTEELCYHKLNPEYTISQIDDDNNSAEFYAYVMTNESVSYGMLNANYFGTTLYSCQTVFLDSGRYRTVVPKWGFIHHDKYHQNFDSFKYFIKDDISYDLHMFLLNEESHEAVYAYRRFMEIVLLFQNDSEKDCFISYIENHLDLFEETIARLEDDYDYLVLELPEKEQVIRRIKVATALKTIQTQMNENGLESI